MAKPFGSAWGTWAVGITSVLGGCSTILGIDNDYSAVGATESGGSGSAATSGSATSGSATSGSETGSSSASSSGTGGSGAAATSSSGTGGTACIPFDDTNDCTKDVCDNGVPVNKPDVGKLCGPTGSCDGAGTCVVPCAGTLGFTAQTSPSGGASPSFVATADLNGDGRPDLAIANADSDWVSVRLGSGNGVFGDAVPYATAYPISIAAADLDGDTRPDLAVANIGSEAVSVLKNLGPGIFAPPVDYPVGPLTASIAALDLNNDGWPDLAVANGSIGDTTGTVNVLINLKNGAFGPAVTYDVGKQPRWLVAVDLNGDSNPDLAVANGASDSVSVLRGNGDGTFMPAGSFGGVLAPSAMTARDLNNDGWPDLAITNYAAGLATVTVLFNNQIGGFLAPVLCATGVSPTGVAAVDLNGDGWADLAVSNAGGDTVSVLINLKNNAFAPQLSFPAGPNPTSVAAAARNADGRFNLVVSNKSNNTVTVLLNTCTP